MDLILVHGTAGEWGEWGGGGASLLACTGGVEEGGCGYD